MKSRMTRIAIIGGSGYTGLELIRLVYAHPDLELTYVTSERMAGKRIRDCFPFLPSSLDLEYRALNTREAVSQADVFFLALPNGVSLTLTPLLRSEGKIVIDLSADYRFKDLKIYQQVYGKSHTDEALANQAVYGLPELYRQQIRASSLIANPGCYATSIILGLLPCLRADLAAAGLAAHGPATKGLAANRVAAADLAAEGLAANGLAAEGLAANGLVAEGLPIVADSKSGISGAGRKLEATYLFTECDQNVKPYNIGKHRHTPEIEQELNLPGKPKVSVLFTPQLVPVRRGILSNIYVPLRQDHPPLEKIWEIYHQFYQEEPFTLLNPLGCIPCLKDVYLSNYCRMGLVLDQRTNMLVIVSVIDNLLKGASGQAVQNLNIILGLDEKAGLESAVPYP